MPPLMPQSSIKSCTHKVHVHDCSNEHKKKKILTFSPHAAIAFIIFCVPSSCTYSTIYYGEVSHIFLLFFYPPLCNFIESLKKSSFYCLFVLLAFFLWPRHELERIMYLRRGKWRIFFIYSENYIWTRFNFFFLLFFSSWFYFPTPHLLLNLLILAMFIVVHVAVVFLFFFIMIFNVIYE